MHILPMSSLAMTPSISALLGTSINNNVLEQINNQYGNGGVIFGQPGNPAAERYQALKSVVQDQLQVAAAQIDDIRHQIVHPYDYVEIVDEEQLRNIPAVMELPILMYEPVRKLFDDCRISGWGYEAGYLPDEDFYGRLINNGTITITQGTSEEDMPEYFVWEFQSTDPDLDEFQLKAIEKTREWIGKWLETEMSDTGKWRDPTDLSNQISRIKQR